MLRVLAKRLRQSTPRPASLGLGAACAAGIVLAASCTVFNDLKETPPGAGGADSGPDTALDTDSSPKLDQSAESQDGDTSSLPDQVSELKAEGDTSSPQDQVTESPIEAEADGELDQIAEPAPDAPEATDAAAGDAAEEADAQGPTAAVIASGQNRPGSIAVDSSWIYWANFGTLGLSNGSVMRAPKSGGTPTQLASGLGTPDSLSVDSINLYWVNIQEQGVVRMALQGGAVTTLNDAQEGAFALVIDATHVYSLSDESVVKVPLAGGQATTLHVAPNAMLDGPAVDDTGVYFGAKFALQILRASKDGTSVVPVVANAITTPAHLAVDATSVYWSDSTWAGRIMKAPKTGGTATEVADGQGSPRVIALDSDYVYWVTYFDGSVKKAPKSGGSEVVLETGPQGAYGLAIDDTYVYWTNVESGTVRRTPK